MTSRSKSNRIFVRLCITHLISPPPISSTHKAQPQSRENPDFPRKDLLDIESLPVETINHLLDRSDVHYEKLLGSGPFELSNQLAGRTIGNLFFENSTRTRTSFELAERRMGADFISLSPAVSSLTKGESLLDTVRVLEAMKLDAIVVRHSSSGVPHFLAEHLPPYVRCINAGDGSHEHPTQALLDAAQLRSAIGDLRNKRVAIIGDIKHSRVARSNIWLLKKLGAIVTLVGPETLLPMFAEEVFGVRVTIHLDDVLAESDAIMSLRIQTERQSRGLFPTVEEYHEMYGITEARMRGSHAVVMHPGPINLGIELDAESAYGPRSLILGQVKRGVAIRMAVLEWLFSGD